MLPLFLSRTNPLTMYSHSNFHSNSCIETPFLANIQSIKCSKEAQVLRNTNLSDCPQTFWLFLHTQVFQRFRACIVPMCNPYQGRQLWHLYSIPYCRRSVFQVQLYLFPLQETTICTVLELHPFSPSSQNSISWPLKHPNDPCPPTN